MEYLTTNYNPYHEYKGIQEVFDFKIYQSENMKRGKDFETSHVSWNGRVSPWGYIRNNCMQIWQEKPNVYDIEYLPIDFDDGEITPYKHYEKVKFSKKGKPIKRKKNNPTLRMHNGNWFWCYDCLYPVYKHITNDIQVIFEICKDYRCLWSGLSKKERQVLVCDIDDDRYNEKTEEEIFTICEEHNIPFPTYLEIHTNNGHYQFGWILSEAILFEKNYREFGYENGHALWTDMLRASKEIFTMADPHFTGFVIKNPNCVNNTETKWYNDTVNIKDLVPSMISYYKQNEAKKRETREQQDIVEVEYTPTEDNVPVIHNSRHLYLREHLTEEVFSYMRENEGKPPTISEMMEIAKDIERKSLHYLKGKDVIETGNEIEATVRSVIEWCKEKYKCSADFNEQSREFSNIVRSAYKQINIIETKHLLLQGYKVKQIAKEFGKSERTIKTYKKEEVDIEKIKLLLEKISSYSNYTGEKTANYKFDCNEALERYEQLKLTILEREEIKAS